MPYICSGGSAQDNCTPLPATEPDTEVTCDNGLDDDCDGLIDGNDPDCNVCVPDEDPETTLCFDGNDNDCDGQTDCSDTSCDGALGAPTTCGVGACQASGTSSHHSAARTDQELPASDTGNGQGSNKSVSE